MSFASKIQIGKLSFVAIPEPEWGRGHLFRSGRSPEGVQYHHQQHHYHPPYKQSLADVQFRLVPIYRVIKRATKESLISM